MTPDPATPHARLAVSAVFFINGVIVSSWVPHIPLVQARLGLSDSLLGVALLCSAVGALVAMPLAGLVIPRVGSRPVTRAVAIFFCLVLPLPILAPSLPLLMLALALFGAGNATMDVAMNAQAVATETRHGKAIMSSFHGLFSVGGLVGSSLGGLLLEAGVSPAVHAGAVSVSLLLLLVLPLRYLLPASVDALSGPTFALPRGPLLGLGVLAFFVLVGEGAMGDWSAVYLQSSLGAGPGLAAAGFAAFSLTMAVGRLTGDLLGRRFGAVLLVRMSSTLAALGLGGALLLHHPVAAIIGFGCVGLGLANLIPILFSAAGRTPGVPSGTAIAAVALTGYSGFLAGPPLIGLVSDAAGLPVALGIVVLFCALTALLAPLVGHGGHDLSSSPRDVTS